MYWVVSAMPDQYLMDSNVCQQEHSSDIVEHIPRGSAARQGHTGRRVEVNTTSPRLCIAAGGKKRIRHSLKVSLAQLPTHFSRPERFSAYQLLKR
jgi:hypothetical protein